jgi:hypothetical protein
MITVPRHRTRLARRLGWFAAATLVVAAFAPSVSADTVITHPSGNPSCTSLGYEFEFKIDTGDLEERAYQWDEGGDVFSNWDGQTITITELSDDGQTFSWTSTLPVSAVFIKAGNDNNSLYTYDPPVLGDEDLTADAGQQGISHVSFCGNAEEPTPPPSTPPPSTPPPSTPPPSTPPPSTPPPSTPPPSTAPPTTPPPSGSVAPTESAPPSATGSVAGETGTPVTTLPPTDSLGDAAQTTGGDGWRLVLLALAGTLAVALLLTPARAVRKDR